MGMERMPNKELFLRGLIKLALQICGAFMGASTTLVILFLGYFFFWNERAPGPGQHDSRCNAVQGSISHCAERLGFDGACNG